MSVAVDAAAVVVDAVVVVFAVVSLFSVVSFVVSFIAITSEIGADVVDERIVGLVF